MDESRIFCVTPSVTHAKDVFRGAPHTLVTYNTLPNT